MSSLIASSLHGKPPYGAPLGILMLETRFPRIPGDMGNPATWPFPVLYRMVAGATAEKVVLGGARGLLPDFVAAARDLLAQGAQAITTTCGFLSIYQDRLARELGVPVATSAMLQVPWVQATLPAGRRVGVVTVSASSLTPAHLAGAGAPCDTPVAGVDDDGEFFRVIVRSEKLELDVALAEREVVEAARSLMARHPDVGAIVLECTNMPPYAAAVQAQTGVPVYDMYSMITWFHAGLRPRTFRPLEAHDK